MAKHNKSVAVVEYDNVFTYDHLFQAFIHCRKGKRFRSTVIDFETDLVKKLKKIARALEHRKYTFGELYEFTIYEPKKRDIVANQFADKLIQWIDCEYILMPAIAPKLIFDNYASQPGKGTDLSRHRLEKAYKKFWNTYHTNEGYILRCDIKSYFGSIHRETLYKMVKELPIDDDCKEMIRKQIYAHREDEEVGVCIGFQSMQWLAVYYLNGLDHYIKEELHIKWYGRYMDDFYLIHHDKAYLQECYAKITEYIEDKLKLKLNKKSGITKLGINMNWLGFQYRLNERGRVICHVTKASIRRYVKRTEKYMKLYQNDDVSLEQISQSLNSWAAHIDNATNSTKMKKYLLNRILLLCDKYEIPPSEVIPATLLKRRV